MRVLPVKDEASLKLGHRFQAIPDWHITELGEGSAKIVSAATPIEAVRAFYQQLDQTL